MATLIERLRAEAAEMYRTVSRLSELQEGRAEAEAVEASRLAGLLLGAAEELERLRGALEQVVNAPAMSPFGYRDIARQALTTQDHASVTQDDGKEGE